MFKNLLEAGVLFKTLVLREREVAICSPFVSLLGFIGLCWYNLTVSVITVEPYQCVFLCMVP